MFLLCFPVAPTAPPDNLRVTGTTSNSITVAWDRVPCFWRNIEITGYQWTVILTSDPDVLMSGGVEGTETNDRILTIPGLIPRSNYTVSVRALRFSLMDLMPMFYTGPSAVITAVTAVPSGNPLPIVQCSYVSVYVKLLCRTRFSAGWDCVLQQQCGTPQ